MYLEYGAWKHWFAGKSCIDCGTTERLEIDHVEPELKIHHSVWSWAEERREAELAKCVVRCNACHMKRHGRTPGGAHGGKLRYESGCRCLECVEGQRERDRVKRRNKRLREARAGARRGVSITKTYDVFCDRGSTPNCQGWADGASSTTSAAEARRQAKRWGWKRIDGQDVCPRCQEADARIAPSEAARKAEREAGER